MLKTAQNIIWIGTFQDCNDQIYRLSQAGGKRSPLGCHEVQMYFIRLLLSFGGVKFMDGMDISTI